MSDRAAAMHGHGVESSHEELLDVFKAAALSVTKLYKTSTTVQSKARVDGYQDCLEDLLALLDKGDVDLRTVRRWALERLDGREPILPTIESEDEVDKTDGGSTPEPHGAAGRRASASAEAAAACTSRIGSSIGGGDTNSRVSTISRSTAAACPGSDTAMQTETEMETESETPSPPKIRTATSTSAVAAPAKKTSSKSKARGAAADAAAAMPSPVIAATIVESAPEYLEPVEVPEPATDHFTLRSAVQYPPTDSFLELANLDLSDRRSASGSVKDADGAAGATPPPSSTYVFSAAPSIADTPSASPTHNTSNARQFRLRHNAARSGARSALIARYSRASTAGQKRKLNFDEIFDVASLGYGKDVFGRGGSKRSRQA